MQRAAVSAHSVFYQMTRLAALSMLCAGGVVPSVFQVNIVMWKMIHTDNKWNEL